MSDADPDQATNESFDPELLNDVLYEAEAILATQRALPVCEAMARVAGAGDLMQPQPFYASIVWVDFEVIPGGGNSGATVKCRAASHFVASELARARRRPGPLRARRRRTAATFSQMV